MKVRKIQWKGQTEESGEAFVTGEGVLNASLCDCGCRNIVLSSVYAVESRGGIGTSTQHIQLQPDAWKVAIKDIEGLLYGSEGKPEASPEGRPKEVLEEEIREAIQKYRRGKDYNSTVEIAMLMAFVEAFIRGQDSDRMKYLTAIASGLAERFSEDIIMESFR